MNYKIIIKSILLSTAVNIILLFSLKKIRSLMPSPEISEEKLVGFAQYFGYPFYFDTIFFLLLISVPLLTLLFVNKFNKNK